MGSKEKLPRIDLIGHGLLPRRSRRRLLRWAVGIRAQNNYPWQLRAERFAGCLICRGQRGMLSLGSDEIDERLIIIQGFEVGIAVGPRKGVRVAATSPFSQQIHSLIAIAEHRCNPGTP